MNSERVTQLINQYIQLRELHPHNEKIDPDKVRFYLFCQLPESQRNGKRIESQLSSTHHKIFNNVRYGDPIPYLLDINGLEHEVKAFNELFNTKYTKQDLLLPNALFIQFN